MPESRSRESFHTVTPYLIVGDADAFVTFVAEAFGATETYRTTGEQGGTHLEVRIGDSMIMAGESIDAATPAYLFLYVDDPDTVFARALDAGAAKMIPMTDGRFGERRGGAVTDPFGNGWFIAAAAPPR
jgi:uncharacterized glyoxalase superfamily protein PhnB